MHCLCLASGTLHQPDPRSYACVRTVAEVVLAAAELSRVEELLCCTVAAKMYRLLVPMCTEGSRAVKGPCVQAIALQQGTCEKDTDRVRHLNGVPPT
jgi:hypothetical protein